MANYTNIIYCLIANNHNSFADKKAIKA